MRRLAFLTLFGLLIASMATATVIRVPDEYTTIQAGIDAASGGDTVLVADGTYTGDGNRDIDFYGKAIVVMSENGPEVTVIDVEGSGIDPHRGFYFHTGEDTASVLQGFTITNGYNEDGGAGIYCYYTSPKITGNIITGNMSWWGGAGIQFYGGPLITGNTISYNETDDPMGSGDGIYGFPEDSTEISCNVFIDDGISFGGNFTYLLVTDNTFRDFTTGWDKTAIYWSGTSTSNKTVVVRNNLFKNFSLEGIAGAIGISGTGNATNTGIIEDNVFRNFTLQDGGAIRVSGTGAAIQTGMIEDNVFESITGYAIELSGTGDPGATIYGYIYNNTFNSCGSGEPWWRPVIDIGGTGGVKIHAYASGNAIFHCNGTAIEISGISSSQQWGAFTSNTIVNNPTGIRKGTNVQNLEIVNTILWDNTDDLYNIAQSEIYYSDISDGDYVGVNGNISSDPCFLFSEKRDYRLLWESPCIDTGHPDSLDPDGTISDMGAYPFDQSTPLTIYLTPDTTTIVRPGELGVTYTLINIEPDPWMFYLRTDVYLPNGKPYPGNPIIGPKKITLNGGKTKHGYVTHLVPGAAPLGIYTYKSRIGIPPHELIDEDSFEFELM